MPSSWELEVESWSIVAKGLDRGESWSASGAMMFGIGPLGAKGK